MQLDGGTPSDGAVVQAIQELKARGYRVTFYPFILMDLAADNDLPDPEVIIDVEVLEGADMQEQVEIQRVAAEGIKTRRHHQVRRAERRDLFGNGI